MNIRRKYPEPKTRHNKNRLPEFYHHHHGHAQIRHSLSTLNDKNTPISPPMDLFLLCVTARKTTFDSHYSIHTPETGAGRTTVATPPAAPTAKTKKIARDTQRLSKYGRLSLALSNTGRKFELRESVCIANVFSGDFWCAAAGRRGGGRAPRPGF